MMTSKVGALCLVLLLLSVEAAKGAVPFQVDVQCASNPDGTVNITAKGTADWRGTVTVRDEKSRLIAIVSKDAERLCKANQEIAFGWDGKNYEGNPAGGGNYTVRVEAVTASPTEASRRVGIGFYSYVCFDYLERSVYMTGFNHMEEGPWTMDHTLPEAYARKMGFGGFPLSDPIPFNHIILYNNKQTVDIHDNLYMPGTAVSGALRLVKVSGRTGKEIWKLIPVFPKDADPNEWNPISQFCPRGTVSTTGLIGMRDTDEDIYCGGSGRTFLHINGKTSEYLSPPIRPKFDNAWAKRLDVKKGWFSGANWSFWHMRVAPNGDILSCPIGLQSYAPVRMLPDGTILWGLAPHLTSPPCAPEFAGASHSGFGTHDNGSLDCDIEGSVYRDAGNVFVKFDRFGQLLLLAQVTEHPSDQIGDLDLSVDGHVMVYSNMHTWNTRLHELDWAQATVAIPGPSQETKARGQLPDVKDPAFLTVQKTPADWLHFGRYLLATKQYEKAFHAFEQVLKESKDPDYQAVALVNIARAWQRQGMWEKELATYERLGQVVPAETGWASLKVAQLEKENGRNQQAVERLTLAAGKEKDKYLRAKLLLQLGGWFAGNEAIKTYREVADTYSFARGTALNNLLPLLAKDKKWQEAESAADELIRHYPLSASHVSTHYWSQIEAGLGKKAEPIPVLKIEGAPGAAGDMVADFALGQDTTESFVYPIGGIPDSPWYYLSQKNTFGWPLGIETLNGRLWVADSCKGRIVGFNLPVSKNRPDENLIIGMAPPKEYGKSAYWTWEAYANQDGKGPQKGLLIPWGMATDGKRLYVSDHALHRIMAFDPDAGKDTNAVSATPLLVLGQNTDDGAGINGKSIFDRSAGEGDIDVPSACSLFMPCAVSCDGQRLAVADSGNHRILIWNKLPTKTGQPADIVLGQKDFVSAIRSISGPTGLNRPRGVYTDGARLFVADTMNHRVLMWNKFPAKNNQPADIVLGLPDFSAEGTWPQTVDVRIGPDRMSYPSDVYFDGKSLYVCDGNNNRVMIWDKLPEKNGQPCDRYLGMAGPGFGIVHGWNPGYGGGCGSAKLNFPMSVRADDKAIYVADTWHSRVLVFLR